MKCTTASAASLAVFLVSVLLQLPTFDRSLVSLDEGQLTAIGVRLLSGEVLYRDIYTGIFPGIYWLTAALLGVFGVDVLVLRIAQVVVNALTATGLFLLVQPMATGLVAWTVPLGYLALAVLSFPVFTMLPYSSLALLAAIGAMLAGRRFVATANPGWGALVGVMLACCVLFKQNYGAFALVAAGVSAVWTRREGALATRSLLSIFTYPAVAGIAVAVVAGCYLAAKGAWPTFIEYTFFTIFHSQMDAFDQPMPPVFGPHPAGDGKFLFFYSPGGLFGAMFHGHSWAAPWVLSLATRFGYGSAWLALLLLPVLAWRSSVCRDSDERTAIRFALPFAGFCFLGIFPSAIWSHLAAVYPPLLVVLAAAWSTAAAAVRRRSARLHLVMAAIGVAIVTPVAMVAAGVSLDTHRVYSEESRLPHVSLHLASRDAKLYPAADEFLRRCAPEGSPVLVAPDMPLLYVTSGRPNPTPYDLIIPGDVRDGVIVERMDAAGVRCVVFNPAMYTQFAAFETLFPRLHAFLTDHFEETGSVSDQGTTWRFLERRRGNT